MGKKISKNFRFIKVRAYVIRIKCNWSPMLILSEYSWITMGLSERYQMYFGLMQIIGSSLSLLCTVCIYICELVKM